MEHNGKISIATGIAANSYKWKNKKIEWSDLVEILTTANYTNETYKEFMNLSKTDQSKIKDVGGFVGGYLRNGRRKPSNVVNRQLLTLDIDFGTLDFWLDFILQYSCAAVLHGTHKHSDITPKYRLVIPLDREVSPDEYVAISRQIAGTLDIELFDPTTFQPERLMFWPSSPKDVEFYSEVQDGEWLSADEVLDSYQDWTDSSLWPTVDKEYDDVRKSVDKQEDPLEKKGIIGAFCRTYTMTEVMDTLLTEHYTHTSGDRYTYVRGSAANGLIVYDDKFAFSHHGTDPSGGKLCNAFDMVRIHMFGHLDEGSKASKREKLPSFKKMEEFARKDPKTKGVIAEENIALARYDFREDLEENTDSLDEQESELDMEWAKELEVDAKGKYVSSAGNLNLIFANDPRLKDAFKLNDFDGKRYTVKSLPWRKITTPEDIKNVDYSGVRNYIEDIYGITGVQKIEDSLSLEFERQSFHPVKDYLNSLEWDGVARIDEFLIKYFGTTDDIYHREALRKMMCGAVARIFRPGTKFDLVLTFVSIEGTGKSSFLDCLGKAWFSDSFMTVTGKEAFEQLQGAWIIEMAELAGLRKTEVEAVKHFITKQEDMFRPAYARTTETFKRQCVFFGTTNNSNFLKDPSGNRRFMPVDVWDVKLVDNPALMEIIKGDGTYIDQMWAEAVQLVNAGEKLYLSKEAETLARIEQHGHSEIDERVGIIEKYIYTLLPDNWEEMDVYDRRNFLNDPLSPKGTISRKGVCVAEIWCECLGKEKNDMDKYKTREINDVLRGLECLKAAKSAKSFSIYGRQRYYNVI